MPKLPGLLKRLLCFIAYWCPGGESLRPLLHRWRGTRVGRGVWIGQLVYLDQLYPEAITLEDNVIIGLRTTIFTHCHSGERRERNGFKPVVIEEGAFIGPHCVILPGVRVGKGAVVKAGSVLTRSVPPRVFWGDDGGHVLAEVTVPLTPDTEFLEFFKGLRPISSSTRKGQERLELHELE